jgi:hypothetical protein
MTVSTTIAMERIVTVDVNHVRAIRMKNSTPFTLTILNIMTLHFSIMPLNL